MTNLRLALVATLVVAIAADILILNERFRHPTHAAQITYVGLDSLGIVAPKGVAPSTLDDGRWSPALKNATLVERGMDGSPREATFISLAPNPTFGHFMEAIRSLRARGNCNFLVKEHGLEIGDESDLLGLVLCGSAIGDAGFTGTLPPDRMVDLQSTVPLQRAGTRDNR